MPEPIAAPVIADEVLAAVAEGRHPDPHSVLGQHGFDVAHERGPFTAIRTRRPLADSVDGGARRRHRRCRSNTSATACGRARARSARPTTASSRATTATPEWSSDDPYRFAPTIGELDLHLIAEGRHEELWKSARRPLPRSLGRRRRRARHRVHRVGAARPRGARRRRVQPLGRHGPRDAQHGRDRASGSSSCPTSSPARSTSSRSSPARAPGS